MPTRDQIITIQQARRSLNLSDDAYRMVLWNAARVRSSKDLDNAGVEKVMAIFEAHGFQGHKRGSTYWRDKADRGGDRSAAFIRQLAEQSRYDLAAMCQQFSQGRASRPEDLTPQERWKLTEMYKAANARETTSLNRRGHAVPAQQGVLFSTPAPAPAPARAPSQSAADEAIAMLPNREEIDALPF